MSTADSSIERGSGRPLVSIVVPVYREEGSLETLVRRVDDVMAGDGRVDYELVFVNDGSPDDSLGVLRGIAARGGRYKVVDLSRNFGKEIALSAGLRYARGDAVVCMDADLQHPPEVIPEMITRWLEGAELVSTHRPHIRRHPVFRRLGSHLFYWFMNRISETRIFAQSTDFCLLDRIAVDQFNAIAEKNRSFRGLVDWLSPKRVWVEFEADPREHGRPGYSYAKLADLALTNLILYSSLPLKLIIFFGMSITITSAALLAWMLFWTAFAPERFLFTPLAMFVVGNTLMIGFVLITLGVIALYIAKIHREVAQRPLYFVRSLINIEPGSPGAN